NILESNNNNDSYDYLSNILDDYYNQDESYNQIKSSLYNRNPNNSFSDDFESKLNLEGSIISDNYYSKSFLEDLKTYRTHLKIIELDDNNLNNDSYNYLNNDLYDNLIDSSNNIIDSYNNIMSSQETIIISSDSDTQSSSSRQANQEFDESSNNISEYEFIFVDTY
ncbi:1697_t:CDS:2, partial [Scutellospora calospora]